MKSLPRFRLPYRRQVKCSLRRRWLWWRMASLLLAILLFLVSCTQSTAPAKRSPKRSTSPPVSVQSAPVEDPNQLVWYWQPNALHLQISADHDVNRYEEQPHALMLCLYQLSSATAWGELAKTPAGVDTLLTCEGFDSSVVQSERLFMQPGEQRQLDVDRLEKARYVALVAGYAHPTAQRASPIFSFPVEHRTKGILFWKKPQYWPGELTIHLILTEQSLQKTDPQ